MKKISIFTATAALLFASSVVAAPVNINKASAGEIASALKGVGESKAQAIVDFRKKNGKFKTPIDITKVKGIGASTFEQNKKDILIK